MGEITEYGEVVPVGGEEEKISAAVRHGISTIIAPKSMQSSIEKLNKDLTININFIFVSNFFDAYSTLFPPEN